MPVHIIDTASKSKAVALLQCHWKPTAIANKIHCSKTTVYTWEKNLQTYGFANPPHPLRRGRPRSIHTAAKKSVLEYVQQHPWIYQDELAMFLAEEWDICVHKSTVCRLLKESRLSHRIGQRVGPQSQLLRTAWQVFMQEVTAEQLVFIDESLFKAQTGWRCLAYGPIGHPSRWEDDMRRGDTWSILPAYTVNGYLPCTGIKRGYYNGEAFLEWVVDELLPHCSAFPGHCSVICLDNVNVHLNRQVKQVVEEKGILLKFLPPYSPDYNPIELTFSMLKAWMRRHFRRLRPQFEGDFGGFLWYALQHSGCDQAAQQHFRHSAGGYQFEGDLEAFQRELTYWADEEEEEDGNE